VSVQQVQAQEKHLLKVLSGSRFLEMESLGGEVPFFIYAYDPEDSLEVGAAKKRLKNKLTNEHGVKILEINLYDLAIEILKERGVWDRLLELEKQQGKDAFLKPLQNMLDPGSKLVPVINQRLESSNADILFITGIGEVFPYIRSHNVLNNLQTVLNHKPMLLFFPGEYKQSQTAGSSLVLFGRLKDDNYYRAFDIRDREA
jgi:hypothetical protein